MSAIRRLPLAACVLTAIVVLFHAGLIGKGSWQGDEYFNFVFFRDIGTLFFRTRLLQWSPRPWSESLLYLYGEQVLRWQRPLIVECLGLVWAALAACCLVPACAGLLRLLIGLSLLALFLVGQDISEMFFWPAAALAYVTTLAAVTVLFWCLAEGLTKPRTRLGAALALTVAAGCTEVGAAFVVVFCGLALAWRLRRLSPSLLWMAPGLGMAAGVLWLIVHGQRFNATMPGGDSSYYHHLLPSVAAAIGPVAVDLVSSGTPNSQAIALTVLGRLLLVLGVRWCWPKTGSGGGVFLPGFAAALMLAAFGSAVAAYYQLGELCCERHDTLRHCFTTLAVAALAVWSVRVWRPGSLRWSGLAVAPLVAAVLLPFVFRLPALVQEYGTYAQAGRALKQTWRSGLRADSATMVLVAGPDGPLIRNRSFVVGTYALRADTDWALFGVLTFFHKQEVTVTPPR